MWTEEQQEVVYSNRYNLNVGFRQAYSRLFHEAYHFRTLIWQYIRRDFVASYRGTMLGFLWRVILPLVPVSVYILLYLAGVFSRGVGMPRTLYVVIGMTLWLLWTNSLSVTMNRFSAEANLLKRVKLPMIVVYLTGLGPILFDLMLHLALMVVLLLAFRIPFQWTWLLLPVLMVPIFLFGTGLGILLSFFAVFLKDLKNIVTVATRYGLFASCVIFPLPKTGKAGIVLVLNPMYHLIENTRQLVVNGRMDGWHGYLAVVVLGVLICLYAVKKIVTMEDRLSWAL